jgi:putative peptide zinc metalloprotease protein
MSALPRLRPDLVLVEQSYRGEQSFIVKDPTTRKYFRFRPLEIAVMRSLDGKRTVAEAADALVDQGLKVSAAAVGRFAEKLKTMGLCERTVRESSVLLMERLRAQRRTRLRTGPFKGDILRLRWSVADPNRFMDRTLPYVRLFFSRQFLIASVALFAVYFVILAL